jgi:long-chain fatty acid transport protein
MNALRTLSAALAALLALAPAAASASGFVVYEMSGEGMAKGSAVAADSDEPAALWYNPGSMAFLPDASVTVGVLAALGLATFEPASGGPDQEANKDIYWLPRLFADVAVTDWMHAGLGVYSIYGLGLSWKNDWVGREDGIAAEMATVSFNPAVSFRILKNVGLGIGFVAMKASADLTNGLPEVAGGDVRFGGEAWAFGGHAGLTIKGIADMLDIGLAYRSRMNATFDGRVDFDPYPEFARKLVDQEASAGITMPDIFTLGFGLDATQRLRLNADVNLVLWQVYDETVLALDDGSKLATVHDYEPSIIARLGMELRPEAVDGLAIRAGLNYDQSPAPDGKVSPTMPDAEKVNLTAGLGYRVSWFRGDLGYMFMYYLPNEVRGADVSPDGTYKTTGHLLALTLSAVVE